MKNCDGDDDGDDDDGDDSNNNNLAMTSYVFMLLTFEST
jgi:hypothetical protein